MIIARFCTVALILAAGSALAADRAVPRVAPGMRAITFSIHNLWPPDTRIEADDRVDLVSLARSATGGTATNQVLATSIRVLAIDPTQTQVDDDQGARFAFTLELSPEQADAAAKADRDGTLIIAPHPVDLEKVPGRRGP